jgi:sarcosine oxidase subunit delta
MSFTLSCPICGRRNVSEFRFGGEDKGPRPAEEALAATAAWLDYVHLHANPAGPQKEWWYHRDGCGSWFSIWRDTTTNLEIPGGRG